jgi:hypothetical protein
MAYGSWFEVLNHVLKQDDPSVNHADGCDFNKKSEFSRSAGWCSLKWHQEAVERLCCEERALRGVCNPGL